MRRQLAKQAECGRGLKVCVLVCKRKVKGAFMEKVASAAWEDHSPASALAPSQVSIPKCTFVQAEGQEVHTVSVLRVEWL
jgi:hypothetical protein